MYPPNAKLVRTVNAASEPLSLAMAKGFLRVEVSADDALIGLMITAARQKCEQICDLCFITTTWRYTIDFLPFASNPLIGYPFPFVQYGGGGGFNRVDPNDGAIFLPFPPLIAISSMTYVNQSGTTQSIDPSPSAGKVIVSAGTPGKIYPAYGTFYPLGQPRPQAVNITYTSGYGPDASDVPAVVPLAMMFLLGQMYENRTVDPEVPQFVLDMLSPIKWGGYA